VQQQPSRKWVKTLILAISSLVFLGLSIIPLIGGVMQNQKTPPQPSANSTVAGDAQSAKALEETEKNYLALLQREPTNISALEGLVQTRQQLVQLGQRKPKDVTDPLQAFIKQQPTNTAVLKVLSQLLLQQQRAPEAITILQNSIQVAKQQNPNPSTGDDPVALELLLGDVYLSQKQFTEAAGIYEQLIQQDPKDYRPLLAKGIMFNDQGQREAALAQLQSSLSLAPEKSKPSVQAIIDLVKKPPGTPATPQTNASPAKP
jgi:tetratricopeptide (TPR) repeat protein